MTASQFQAKSELLERIQRVFKREETGMLTVLTDNNRSVMMRFTAGELTSARCRSWDVANTIEALLEAKTVKYTFTAGLSEDKPPIMGAQDFMDAISMGVEPLEVVNDVVDEVVTGVVTEVVTETVSDSAAEPEQEKPKLDKRTATRMNLF